jgi:hypothetical protein
MLISLLLIVTMMGLLAVEAWKQATLRCHNEMNTIIWIHK